jgi:hypothetical protein
MIPEKHKGNPHDRLIYIEGYEDGIHVMLEIAKEIINK